ncbi:hypothetical protein I5515_02700 [Acinetobacter calcoaceticus]|uniref:hypothetical protein n=1 Tax=Acinetobacter calcoaceticus TaxID=471 RepID=UPI0018FF6A24|nr:hypothetical protein [Acinetobacter calcoaceticus]MBJ9720706.1 hypothetical protein [Acinetobacter calcoaceticus]
MNKKFHKEKVVFKYPIENNACFLFTSSYELFGLIRKATKEEELLGTRMDEFKNIDEYWLDEFRINK